MKTELTISDFVLQFPEFKKFACEDPEAVKTALLSSGEMISAGSFGSKARLACLYLTAHMIAISPAGIASGLGQVTKEKKWVSCYGQMFESIKPQAGGAYCRVV